MEHPLDELLKAVATSDVLQLLDAGGNPGISDLLDGRLTMTYSSTTALRLGRNCVDGV